MNIYEEAAALKEANRAFAIAMITESKGSTPRSSARMLVREEGTTLGTIGGGPVEQYIIAQSLEAIAEGKNRTCHYTLKMKQKQGMHCGGEMAFFIDVDVPGTSLLLVGAGHVNREVARFAVQSGFRVTVVDDREILLDPEAFPPSTGLIYGKTLKEAVDQAGLNDRTYVLVATGDEDKGGLNAVIHGNPRFLAMLGSRRKAIMVKKELAEEGWTGNMLNRIICPAGLDIGAESPSEIALSLISQMVMFRTGSSGGELYRSSQRGRLIVVRGAGDIATGTIACLHRAGYAVVALETELPTVIRRTVAFAEAVRKGSATVEGITARLVSEDNEIEAILEAGEVAVAVDPHGRLIERLEPSAVIDAILAKKNLGTNREMAGLTIGFGPGFTAGDDVHFVIETSRGHDLAAIIEEGAAKANTGIPGTIEGYSEERIIRSPSRGVVEVLKDIGSLVEKGEIIAKVEGNEVPSTIDGMIRGMICPGTIVSRGMKMGDIDPRGEKAQFLTISDKARSIGGSVLEILLRKKICP